MTGHSLSNSPVRLDAARRHVRAALAAIAVLVGGLMAVAAPAEAAPMANLSRASSPGPPPGPIPAPRHISGWPNLGGDVYVFTPTMPQRTIQQTVDAIAEQQLSNQFGTERYALLFEPGTYGTATDPLVFQVGYYTQVAGLGTSPKDVVINGSIDVYNQCRPGGDCNALDNFWRSLSNLTINVAGGSGCRTNTEFWAASQAAPMRRVIINGKTTLMDYCTGGSMYSSGGFIADSAITGAPVINGSQQQYLIRNSVIDGWSNGVWNQVFSGVVGAPPQSFGQPGAQPYTTLTTSPMTAEQPFLYVDDSGQPRVFVPAARRNTSGTSWSNGTAAGHSVPLGRFFVANPDTPLVAINSALALGKDLLLTPGVYALSGPIRVLRPDTVVLGVGLPTLVPQRGAPAMDVANSSGVKLSGMIFDAGPRTSAVLLKVGFLPGLSLPYRPDDPTRVQDVFFRVGGAAAGSARSSLVVNASNVILDDVWAWRADHGSGVGWTQNRAPTGVVINGNDVTAYGLFVEHYQGYNVIWNGRRGTDIFFQNEMPYDVPSQQAWQSAPTVQGFPAFNVTSRARDFQGYGMGSYCNFNQGVDIHATEAFAAPHRSDVQFHDVLTRFLNGSGGIDSVINGVGDPVDGASPGPANVIAYP